MTAKYTLFEGGFSVPNRKKWQQKCLKTVRRNSNIQPFARQLFDDILSVQLPQQKILNCISLKLLWISDIYFTFIMRSNFQTLRSFFFPLQQFHNLLQLVLELRTLHTVGANKCTWILSLSLSHSNANLEVTTVEQWQLQMIFEVTWQRASKHFN